MIQTCFHAGDLEPFEATHGIPVDGWEQLPRITLREAARLQSPWNSFMKNRCNCKQGTCDTRRCYCKKNGIECSSHCQKGQGCRNKPCEKENKPPSKRIGYSSPAEEEERPPPKEEERSLAEEERSPAEEKRSPAEEERSPPEEERLPRKEEERPPPAETRGK